MFDLNLQEFKMPEFKQSLLSTSPSPLSHNVASQFWGTGPKGQGMNHMGKILMEFVTCWKKKNPNRRTIHNHAKRDRDKKRLLEDHH